jgi:hypothetical protein
LIGAAQHKYTDCINILLAVMLSIKNKCPRNGKRGQFFFERRCSVFKGLLDQFSKDFRIFHLVFKGRGSGFSDVGHFGWFNTGIRSGFSDVGLVFLSDFGLGFSLDCWTWFFRLDFGLGFLLGLDFLDWFFFRTLDSVFLSDVGSGFSFGRWIL